MFKKIAKKIIYKVNQTIPLRRKLFLKEIDKRSKLPFSALSKLSKHISITSAYSLELHPPNDWYGHAKILKKFLGLPQGYHFKFIIEHGVVLSDHVNNLELESDLPTIITMSNFRVKKLQKYKSSTVAIGPYIHYANHFLTPSEIISEKKRLGKCLLVLPSHSTLELKSEYDVNKFCEEIKKLGKNFQTIRVCLYWKDALHRLDRIYKACGFECVTAGHILDPNFLPRLKSIIYLSDYTISNDAGTHVGYCIYMNKPHLIIPQKHTVSGRKSEIKIATSIEKADPYKEVIKAFKTFYPKILKKQIDTVNKYWGISEIKTKKQLLDITNIAEYIYEGRLID